MKIFTPGILLSASLVLSACLGGESDFRPGPESIRELTGLAPPAETAAAQTARGPDIVSRMDSLIISARHIETSLAEAPAYLRADCAGTRCEFFDPETGMLETTIDLPDLRFSRVVPEPIGSRHGITLMSWEGRLDEQTEFEAYGAWMEHGGFSIRSEAVVIEGVGTVFRGGLAGGDLTGARPTGSATWLGLMVGTPATGNARGDRLQGIAALNYDMDAGGLDIGFSSIKNVDRGADHSTPVVMFDDITIASDGTFQAGATGNRIQGGFYGPEHVEAAGVFEQANIVGAFGAKRQ